MYTGIHIKYPLLSILMNLEFSGQNFEISQKTNLTKIRPVEAELFHADVHTDGRIEKQA